MTSFKAVFLAAATVLTALLLPSCDKNGKEVTPTYSVTLADPSLASQTVDYKAQTLTVPFTSEQDWQAAIVNQGAADWISFSPKSGKAGAGSLVMSLKENSVDADRSATIQIVSGTAKASLSVTQKKKNALVLSSDKIEMDSDGGEAKVQVNYNVDYTVAVEYAAEDWIKIVSTKALSTSTITLSIAENKSRNNRSGKVTVTGGELQEVITVYQDGLVPSIVLSSHDMTVSDEGGAFSIEVKSNVEVEVTMPSDSWLHRGDTKSISTTTYSFVADYNPDYEPRTARIVFTDKENTISETVTVTQKQKDALILSSSRIDAVADGGKASFSVRSNLDYKVFVQDGVEWVGIVATKALTDSTVNISIEANKSQSARSARIYVEAEEKSDSLTVYQEGLVPGIVLSEKKVNVDAKGGAFQVEVSSNVEVSVTMPSATWLKQDVTRSYTTTTYGFLVSENDQYAARKAVMTFSSPDYGLCEEVTVIQSGKQIEDRTTTFDENAIVVSFGNISDTHIDAAGNAPSTKLRNALSQLKSQAALHDADGIDAILVDGDLIDRGWSSNYVEASYFKNIYESVFKPSEVPMVYSIGNHDVTGWWNSMMVTNARNLRNYLGDAYFTVDEDVENRDKYECRHCVFNGYNVLCVSPVSDSPVTYDAAAKAWLDSKLAELTEAEPDKYVLVLTHPMIYNTVYGSTLGNYWYTDDLTSILDKYPQAVVYGGHLHFPVNDPRSIWQGNFTVMGDGSTRYMAFEGGSYYANKAGNTTLTDKDEYSQGLLTQIDASGNMRITRMDFYNNTTIGEPWEISYPDPSGKSHLEKYSTSARKSANTAPKLSSLEVEQAATTSSVVPCTAKWAAAEDDEFAHHYELELTSASGAKTIVWIMSDFYRHGSKADMSREYSYSLGSLVAGNYSLSLVAVDSWDARSSALVKEFTVEGSTIDPSTLPEPYVDMTFVNGTITDSKGNVTVSNSGAVAGSVSVTMDGSSYKVDALSTGPDKYAMCEFGELTSSGAFKAFAQNGFSVEAFYVDRTGSTAVQGIVCGTEAGGWGLAERATGVPYFIVGEGSSSNSYKSTDAASAVSNSELSHLVAVYNPAEKTMSIYVNGSLSGSTSVTGTFFPGAGDTFNRFCLGADIKKGNSGVDFPTADMVIVDANIYGSALNATQVSLAYEKAKEDLKENASGKSLNILAIGNSFSVDAMEYLYPMLKDAGYEDVALGNLYIGGCSLQTHASNLLNNSGAYTYYQNTTGSWTSTSSYRISDALKGRKWDYVSIQQVSGLSGMPDSYEPYLSAVVDSVKAICPDAKLMWHMTWAYQGNSTHSDFPKYDSDQMTMYNAIVNAVQSRIVPREDFSLVISSGTAVQNLRTSYLGDNLTRDGYHMSYDRGRVVTAMMWAKQITGCDLSRITTFPSEYSYDDKLKAAMKDAVEKACSKPFEVTESAYPPEKSQPNADLQKVFTEAGYALDEYTELSFTYTLNAYYNSTGSSYLYTAASNSDEFAATGIMSKSDLPEGTVIVLKSGYQYRPEGWTSLSSRNSSSTRPTNVTSQIVVVDSSWWGSWNYRAFNLAQQGNPHLTAAQQAELPNSIAFFVPKK